MAGWVKLHRGIFDNEIWKNEQYSKSQAFIDLILRANHKERLKTFDDGTVVKINRGELITSQYKLSEIWDWDRRKVSRFLNILSKNNMIEFTAYKNKYTRIKIINYDKYQSVEREDNNKFKQQSGPGTNLNLL